MAIPPERAQWSSERAFILTTTAAAVGLGNLWRFPYMVGENGGGAFIIAYVLAVAIVGMPLMMLELAAGRRARGSPVAMFRYLHPRAAVVGWLIVGLTTIIMSYYLVITGWTLGYTTISIIGGLQPSALSFTPINLSLAGRPFLVVMDMFAATQVVVASGIIGGGLISWLIPRERMIGNLGDRWRARANFVITFGRYLALPVVAVLLYTWMT